MCVYVRAYLPIGVSVCVAQDSLVIRCDVPVTTSRTSVL